MTQGDPARVLVVDDDRGIREFVSTVLTDEGYRVDEAVDGRDALAAAERDRPDLILLDMRMPVMDGWEFARTYRERPGPHAPIVIVTAALDVAKDAREIGADGFLAKPFQLDDLLHLVRTHARS
ncbi:MAG TPA: response regulator [Candidatus Limnocylindria bacterium]|nr:response regulator [Candidatus Limnocylindria bacterium]